MKYVIWTLNEEHALCKALAASWLAYGLEVVDPEHHRPLIAIAAAPEHHNGEWRPRKLQARSARDFIEKHKSMLEKLLGVDEAHHVEGYSTPMTVKEMRDEIVRLNAEVAELRAKVDPVEEPVTVTVEVPHYKPQRIEFIPSPVLPQKKRVAIAGLHDKHRDRIAKAFPQFDIRWIEPRDNDALIKSKASGRITIACTYGTNGNVLKLLHNISQCHTVGGASGVRETLARLQQ